MCLDERVQLPRVQQPSDRSGGPVTVYTSIVQSTRPGTVKPQYTYKYSAITACTSTEQPQYSAPTVNTYTVRHTVQLQYTQPKYTTQYNYSIQV